VALQVGDKTWVGKSNFTAKIADFTQRYPTRENSQKYRLSTEPLKMARASFPTSIYKFLFNSQLLKSRMQLNFEIPPRYNFPTKNYGLVMILKKVLFFIVMYHSSDNLNSLKVTTEVE